MEKSTYIFGGLAIVIIAVVGIGISQSWINPNPEESEVRKDSPSSPPEAGIVKRIIDPITFELESGHVIRYIGVRTPSASSEVQCFGKEALLANESIIGKEVRLEAEPLLARSSDGAWTMYVWLIEGEIDPLPTPTPEPTEPIQDTTTDRAPEDDIAPDAESLTDTATTTLQPPNDTSQESDVDETPQESEDPRDILINERILEGGFGFPVVSEDMKYGKRILSAAQFASATGKGLWGQCEVSEEGGLSTETISECVIKGKVSVNGEKIYRTPECPAYEQTTVIQNDGGQWFCASDLAEDAGFTKGSDCP